MTAVLDKAATFALTLLAAVAVAPPAVSQAEYMNLLRDVQVSTSGATTLFVAGERRPDSTAPWRLRLSAVSAILDEPELAWHADIDARLEQSGPTLFFLATKPEPLNVDPGSGWLIVNCEEPAMAIVCDAATGDERQRLPAARCVCVTPESEQGESLAFFATGNGLAISSIDGGRLGEPRPLLNMSGIVRGAAITPSRSDGTTAAGFDLIAACVAVPESVGTHRLAVWRVHLSPAAELREVSVLVEFELPREQSEIGVVASVYGALLLLPYFDEDGGAVLPLEFDQAGLREFDRNELIRDPRGPVPTTWYPGFGSAAWLHSGGFVVSVPGDPERSALFGYSRGEKRPDWRIDGPLGADLGTRITEGSGRLFVASGAVGTGIHAANGSVFVYRIVGGRKPRLERRLREEWLRDQWGRLDGGASAGREDGK